MALFLFTKAAIEDKPIDVYNYGEMSRDFTYIDDIVEGIKLVIENPANENKDWSGLNPLSSSSSAPHKIYNIGNNNPVRLLDFINQIEIKLGKKLIKILQKFNLVMCLPLMPILMICRMLLDTNQNIQLKTE